MIKSGGKIFLASLVLVAMWVSFASTANARESAASFGPWLFTDKPSAGLNPPPTYVLAIDMIEGDARTPRLQITCTIGGGGYSVELFLKTRVMSPGINIAIDNRNNLQWRGEMENFKNFGQFGMLRSPISTADVYSLATARKELVATSPGLGQSFVFNVSETAKAFRVLKAACDD